MKYLSAPSTVKKCSCKHEYQDKRYGKDLRVMNPCKAGPKADDIAYRCTVCHTKHT